MVWVTPADPQHVLNMRPRSSSFLQNVISLNCHLRVKLLTYSHPIFEFFSCLFKNDESMTQELNISDEHIKYVSKTPSILFTKSFTFNDQMKLQRSITIFLSSKNPLFIQKLASSSIKCSSAQAQCDFCKPKPKFKLTYLHIIYGTKAHGSYLLTTRS